MFCSATTTFLYFFSTSAVFLGVVLENVSNATVIVVNGDVSLKNCTNIKKLEVQKTASDAAKETSKEISKETAKVSAQIAAEATAEVATEVVVETYKLQ